MDTDAGKTHGQAGIMAMQEIMGGHARRRRDESLCVRPANGSARVNNTLRGSVTLYQKITG